jgi:hypothetical protein
MFPSAPQLAVPPNGRTLGHILVDDLAARVSAYTIKQTALEKETAALRRRAGMSRDERARWIRTTHGIKPCTLPTVAVLTVKGDPHVVVLPAPKF